VVQDVHDFINFLFIIDWYGVDSEGCNFKKCGGVSAGGIMMGRRHLGKQCMDSEEERDWNVPARQLKRQAMRRQNSHIKLVRSRGDELSTSREGCSNFEFCEVVFSARADYSRVDSECLWLERTHDLWLELSRIRVEGLELHRVSGN
jgi:hypothetical protein